MGIIRDSHGMGVKFTFNFPVGKRKQIDRCAAIFTVADLQNGCGIGVVVTLNKSRMEVGVIFTGKGGSAIFSLFFFFFTIVWDWGGMGQGRFYFFGVQSDRSENLLIAL